ncbi:DNA-directed RNA polymerase III subunit rpc6-like [Dorcoceras hygrometricum]|uniref:DNA-directed RNA polymerase III subunit rpc6-like n=1 Tax=Dorcoceras hygrometricum TaxID=472368 RepID=A0A2Z7CKM0_9LAMI|nr:DNA-directed RNA polymerase III subunit rpc6-like [Dorcoceras hygrometricum]
MSRSLGGPSAKRKRPETDAPRLVDAELAILNSIKSKKDSGIWIRDIKLDTKLTDHVVNKSLKSLIAKKLVKEVVNIQYKGKKHYMAVEFEPSKEITGGEWYTNGNLDKELINALQRLCLKYMMAQRVATLQGVQNELKRSGVVNFEVSAQQVSEILNSMVLDDQIIEVKSTGLGDYHSIPIGTICYRTASVAGIAKGAKVGAFASTPCGACPRISLCTSEGLITPSSCVYYSKWLDIDF